MTLDPIVQVPLLRAFSRPEYRDEFLRGQIRLTLVSVYRDLECSSRVDQSEGEARHIVLGAGRTPVHYGGSWHNPIYILSLSNPVVDKVHLLGKYGPHLVQLADVETFVRDLANSAQAQPPEGRDVTEIHLAPVRYNRDLTLDPEPDRSERHLLMWAQKGAEFAADHEVRLAIFLSGPNQDAPQTWTVHTSPPAIEEPRGQVFAT